MKQTIGVFTLIAAIVLIACSATTLFHTAFDSAVGTWQQWTQGSQIVAVIIWEAGAVIAITYCFRHGHAFIAIAGSLLLILAMGYTLSQELRQQASAQEGSAIARDAKKGKLELVRGELDNAIAQRNDLQKLRKLTDDQRAALADARAQIAKLTDKWEAQIDDAPAATAPGVALIARWTGLNINDSADLDPLIKMAFWTMARVFALPLAVFGITLLGAATLPSTATKAEEGQPSGLTIHRPQREPLAKIAGVERRPMQIDPVFSPVAVSLPAIENAHSEATNQPVVKPDVSPDPDGGTPVAIPDVRIAEHSEMFEIPNVVKIDGSEYEPPVKSGKRRRDEALHETAVKRFFSEIYDAAEIETTGKGGWKSGGTPASAVRKDYESWCVEHKLPILKGSHFGRFAAAYVDVAPSAGGKRYGCVKRIAKTQPKRRVA